MSSGRGAIIHDYDPVYAHEYYMRNRELKGRDPADLNKKDKAKWTSTKAAITQDKRIESKQLSEQHKIELENLRNNAQQRAEVIRQKLNEIVEKLNARLESLVEERNNRLEAASKNAQEALERIAQEAQRKLRSLPPLPKNAHSSLIMWREREIERIRGEAKNNAKAVAEGLKKEKESIQDEFSKKTSASDEAKSAKDQLEAISSELKSVVEKARKNYNDRKTQMDSKYEAAYQREFDALAQTSSSKGTKK